MKFVRTPHQLIESHERERELLEQAREEIRSGLSLDDAEVQAWLDGLEADDNLPLPKLRRPIVAGQ
jgi:hypothetical protein